MTEIRNILVATDLSERSDRAAARALKLASSLGAKLTALSVVDDAMPDDLVRTMVDRVADKLKTLPQGYEASVDFTPVVLAGEPTETILTQVEERAPDLLVLGTHRPRPFLDMLRETTMQRIVRRTDTCVLLVCEPATQDYAKVDLACDFSPAATAALALSKVISPDAAITPVHVVMIPYRGMLGQTHGTSNSLEKTFLAEARRYDIAWRKNTVLPKDLNPTEFPIGSAYHELADRARRDKCQLIAAGAHGRVGSAPAILGSLASDLMRDPPCDILIARPG